MGFKVGDDVRIMLVFPTTWNGYNFSDRKLHGKRGKLIDVDESNRPYLVEYAEDDSDSWSVDERTSTIWCAEIEPAISTIWINGHEVRPHHFYRWMVNRIREYVRKGIA